VVASRYDGVHSASLLDQGVCEHGCFWLQLQLLQDLNVFKGLTPFTRITASLSGKRALSECSEPLCSRTQPQYEASHRCAVVMTRHAHVHPCDMKEYEQRG